MSSSDTDDDIDYDNDSDDDSRKKLLIQQFVKECVQMQSSLTKPLYRVNTNDRRELVYTTDNNSMTLEQFANQIVTYKSFKQTMINRAKSEISNAVEVFKEFGGMYESLEMLRVKCHEYYIELELEEKRKKLKRERKKSNKLEKEQDELNKLKKIEEYNYIKKREARIELLSRKNNGHHDNHSIKF